MAERIVIIGAGQAGSQAAASARAAGFAGEIVLLGSEAAPPYQRPPLSKAYLQGELALDRLALRAAQFYERSGIDLRLATTATAIDPARRVVATFAGEDFAYDRLLLATGAIPRRLSVPGAELRGVHYLRTVDDAGLVGPVMSNGGPIVIVGAGYIGLEVAASARKAGLDVTVVETAARVLARVAGAEISSFFDEIHRANGAHLRLGEAPVAFEGGARVEQVLLSSGAVVPCNAVLVGIGAAPATELAQGAGLKLDNGIWTDEFARTSDPAIWAAGDCASHPSAIYGRRLRLESVPNAIEQAKAAGAGMAGRRTRYDCVPWFWSDQYDIKLQTAGVWDGADEVVLRGAPASRAFAAWYLREGRVIAVDAVNDPASFAAGKQLIAARAAPAPKKLADPSSDLKSLLPATSKA